LENGEVHILKSRYIRETCADFNGLWRNKEGRDTSSIVQEGRSVTMTNSDQPWSPATGTVSGNVLTLVSPFMVHGLEGTLSNDQLCWATECVWHSLGAPGVAGCGLGKRIVLAGVRIADSGSSNSEDEGDLQGGNGRKPASLQVQRQRRPLEPQRIRPRLGIDIKTSRPKRGNSPQFNRSSFSHMPERPQPKRRAPPPWACPPAGLCDQTASGSSELPPPDIAFSETPPETKLEVESQAPQDDDDCIRMDQIFIQDTESPPANMPDMNMLLGEIDVD